ncbi:MAG: hypothetical protein SF182_10840 [Deltaproteobacteria bacterium]|nr:hypothetical protein [Deltaproteobacteria bacterium]
MTAGELIAKAEVLVGPVEPADSTRALSALPELLSAAAPDLARVLRQSSIEQCAVRFDQLDGEAASAQVRFHRLSALATWTIFAATIAAAIMAAVTPFLSGMSQLVSNVSAGSLGLFSAVAGGVSAMTLFQIERGQLLQRWITTRARAEMERVRYFERVVDAVTRRDGPNVLLALTALECFRRFQLVVQSRYYASRTGVHRSSADWSVWIGAIGALVVALGSGVAGLGATFDTRLGALAGLGLIGAALGAVASRREEIRQDQRNASRYESAARDLSEIIERHSAVQEAVARGEMDTFAAYVRAAHERISLEHRQWVQEAEEAGPGLMALQQALGAGTGGAAVADRERVRTDVNRLADA